MPPLAPKNTNGGGVGYTEREPTDVVPSSLQTIAPLETYGTSYTYFANARWQLVRNWAGMSMWKNLITGQTCDMDTGDEQSVCIIVAHIQ